MRRRLLLRLTVAMALALAGLSAGGLADDAATTPAASANHGYDHLAAFAQDSDRSPSGPASLTTGAEGPLAPIGFAPRADVAAEEEAAVLNGTGRAYPRVLDPRTGEPIPAPDSGLTRAPVAGRAPWGAQERGAFIKEWYERGYSTPEGGWAKYDIHHITPREYGGTNDFNNLVPVLRGTHQQELNAWWRGYP